MAASGIVAGIVAARSAVSLAGSAPVPRSSGAHGLDKAWFLDVNSFARSTGWLHTPMYDYATYGLVLFGALLIIGWWGARRSGTSAMAAALWAGAGTVIAVGVAQPINHAVAEARPWESLPHALILAGHSTDFSFPSDHGVMAGAVTAGLLIYNRRLGIISAIAGLVLCFARVYIGAHYPQDVAGGALIGAAVVLLGYYALRIPLRMLVSWFSKTPLRPLVAAAPAANVSTGGGEPGQDGPAGRPDTGRTPARHRAPR